jgi:hypothetical protein
MSDIENETTGAIVKRDLDGIHPRIKIDGKWENRCLTDLCWGDVERWMRGKCEENGDDYAREFYLGVARHLHERLRAIGDQLDIREARR